MKRYTISELAKLAGLSRASLLYYHRIGLLPAAGRAPNGYRYYLARDLECLRQICSYRAAGLALRDIAILLRSKGRPQASVLRKRLSETSAQIADLRNQQELILGMLKRLSAGPLPLVVDRKMWVEMLQAAGMSQESMNEWHAEFERRAPKAHHEFLRSLGIAEDEARRIRQWCLRAAIQ